MRKLSEENHNYGFSSNAISHGKTSIITEILTIWPSFISKHLDR
jgi:hypothetical protein